MSCRAVSYLNYKANNQKYPERKNGANNRMQTKIASSLLVLMGSLDWLTTIVGIIYFEAVEGNPFLAGLASTNLPVFTAIKLGTAFFVGFLFYQADKTLKQMENKSSKGFVLTRYVLKGAYLASLIILFFAIINNVLSVANAAN